MEITKQGLASSKIIEDEQNGLPNFRRVPGESISLVS